MNSPRRLVEIGVLAGCAFLLTGAILTQTLAPGDTPSEGNALWRLILSISYFSVAAILIPYRRETLYVIRRNWPVIVLVGLAFVSCFWTETPALAFRRSIAVAGATLLGIAFAVRLSLEEQLRIFSWVFRVIAVLSLVAVIFFPGYGISNTPEQEWRGILGYKNAFGSVMAMSALVEWQLLAYSRFSKILNWLALLLSCVLLYFSRSITPLVAVAGTFVLIEFYKFAVRRLRVPLYATLLVLLIILAVGGGVYATVGETIMNAMGRTSNLTGRTEIWSWVVSFILQRPILGYGYSGFWVGASSASTTVERAVGAFTMYSHNGYLEIFLNLGLVGFLLTLIFLVIGAKRVYYWAKFANSSANLWPLALFTFFLLYNLGECTILLQDLQWSICVAVFVATDPALLPLHEESEEEIPLQSGAEFA